MRVSIGGLTLWSFLMATGARRRADGGAGLRRHVDGRRRRPRASHARRGWCWSRAPRHRLHALGYLVVTAGIAVLVFDKLGVGILRRVWFNVDLIWAAALVATGAMTLVL
jgi:hypothetical protein